ncbi:pyruvate formate-lyase-activating protein [Cellulomonas chengniuliangii]|uniref:Pyruvate formate-lyase-activating enzyme n=1 Tax=Cellulomonas chengniuliangii TaxID=2968084 RepID=A0ABY5KVQ4_9CELL|nr:pyruvate formate-lyase-activating protein [Cellulomonas chengniuliangii]MCC2308553.1 pyruvate formate lyase-activating protein [Cellulomonas chengniuliangii]MCC2317570.1 pyruvate formate lyase-activating protein [Cellulomonas chengniuliangii]UUI73918.1 pyruvate formate-lyase-activating protein [Cellulomonas chengniuliangii]
MNATSTAPRDADCGAPVVELGLPVIGGSHHRSSAGTAGLDSSEASRSERFAQMRAGELGSLHSWELVTAVDGPGTRLTTFLSGCPLRCLYCHNPDTMEMRRGEPITADELLARIARYRPIFEVTGGGLTISGGEPLMQPAFVARVLRGAKEMGIRTALDTSGYLGAHCTDEMLDDIDLVLLDVKSGIPETYRKVTGRDLQPTLDFGRRLAARGTEIWVRFVLVPGLTDAPENVDAVADYVATLSTVSRVEVLPFHQMGRDKWESLGLSYELEDAQPPSPELVARVRDQFRERGLTVY